MISTLFLEIQNTIFSIKEASTFSYSLSVNYQELMGIITKALSGDSESNEFLKHLSIERKFKIFPKLLDQTSMSFIIKRDGTDEFLKECYNLFDRIYAICDVDELIAKRILREYNVLHLFDGVLGEQFFTNGKQLPHYCDLPIMVDHKYFYMSNHYDRLKALGIIRESRPQQQALSDIENKHYVRSNYFYTNSPGCDGTLIPLDSMIARMTNLIQNRVRLLEAIETL